jgi:DNA-binding NarL/FixJ family response regulator
MSAEVFGRDAELGMLTAFLDQLPAGAAAMVLAGEPGAGKTTLLRAAFGLAASRELTILQTRPARNELSLAFAGLADLLELHLDVVLGDLPRPQARALRVALLLEHAPAQPPDPWAIALPLRGALAALAATAPVLLLIDDVQWLDAPTGAALAFAFRRLEHEPVGLLCAQRTPAPGASLPLGLDSARQQAGLLPVGGLSLGALYRMLRTSLDVTFSRQQLRRIEASSGGNPFIALEIGRALVRRGGTASHDGSLPLPHALSDLVGERLSALAPEVAGALQFVAVMPDAVLDRYLTAGADAEALDAAVVAGVLEHEAGRLRFSHPLLAAAVASAIPPHRSRQLHAAAAATVQLPEEQARHRALATPGHSEQVAVELAGAAASAAARGAPVAAAELLGLAAGLTPDEHAKDRQARQLGAARQLAVAGETRAATAMLERLIAASPAGPARSDALAEYGKLRQDDLVAATALLEQALFEAGADQERRVHIRLALSHQWLMRGDAARALAIARVAIPDAEAGSPTLLASALARTFDLGLMNGDPPDEDMLARALDLERSAGVPPAEASPSLLAGMWHLHQGRLDLAEAEIRYSLGRAHADGDEYLRAESLLRLSQVAVKRGDLAGAAAHAAECLEVSEQLDLPHMTCAALHGYASAALLAGDASAAAELAARGADLARRTGDEPFVVMHAALLGSIELATGQHQAAAARFRPLLSQMKVLGIRPSAQAIWADAAEALAAAGDLDAATGVVAELGKSAREPVTAAVAARCRGIVAAGRGDTSAALTELTAALRLPDHVSPIPVDRGRALLALGSLQRRIKQRAAARASLTEAAEIFDRIGARLWAARARAELARIGGRAPGPEDLTSTEQRVAELVATGLSNKQVAAELFVTVRAVESTLTKTYAKLGVRSRTELATRMRDRLT